MDPQQEIKQQLVEIRALARDTHRLVRAVRRHQLLDTWGKVIFWALVLASSWYGYKVYIEPLIGKFQVGQFNPVSSLQFPTSADLQKLIESGKAGQK